MTPDTQKVVVVSITALVAFAIGFGAGLSVEDPPQENTIRIQQETGVIPT